MTKVLCSYQQNTLKSQKHCKNPQKLFFGNYFCCKGYLNRAKHQLYWTNSFHYDLFHQISHPIKSCFTCSCYLSGTNPDGPAAFSSFMLLDQLSNHALEKSSSVHHLLYVPWASYAYPMQTLCSKSSHDNCSRLFSHHHLLRTTQLHYYLCTIYQ